MKHDDKEMFTMAKYHVDPQTGATGLCGAGSGPKARGCPYGGDSGVENHFANKNEAETAGQEVLKKLYGDFPEPQKKPAAKTPAKEAGPKAIIKDGFAIKGNNTFEIPTTTPNEGYMGHPGWTGSKCPKNYLPNTEAARLIRDDIKKATGAGWLPEGLKYSVQKRDYSVDVTIGGLGRERDIYDYDSPSVNVRKKLKPEFQEIVDRVTAIHNSYNYNSSNAMVDHFNTGYYGQVKTLTEVESAWKKHDAARVKLNRIVKTKTASLPKENVYADPDVTTAAEEYFATAKQYHLANQVENIEWDDSRMGKPLDWDSIDTRAEIKANQTVEKLKDSFWSSKNR